MGRGNRLSSFEMGQIMAYKNRGLQKTEISRLVKRSRKVVSNYLENPANYGAKKSPGRPALLTPKDQRRILRLASNEQVSANALKEAIGTQASRRTVSRYLNKCPHIQRQKMKVKPPPLTEEHKQERLKFARNHMSWTTKWSSVVFSDEKKFNLDGPDGWNYYWHDLRKEPKYHKKRIQGGGSVMVWGAFGSNGKMELAFVDGRMDSPKYQAMLDTYLVPFGPIIGGQNWIFQQDNAPCHASKSTIEWFQGRNSRLLKWPSRSPDLDPIENLWGILVRTIYTNGRQFEDVRTLKQAILDAWEKLPLETLKKLVNSMQDRMFEVILKKGGATKY